ARDIVTSASLPNSIADLSVSADGLLLTSENSGTIRQFELPETLDETVTGSVLAETNGTYLSTARLDSSRKFKSETAGADGTLYIGGYVTFPAATNLLAITRSTTAAAHAWQLYE